MKGLASATPNVFTGTKSTVSVKRANILRKSKEAAERARTTSTVVDTKITSNTDVQDKVDHQKMIRLVAIGIKDATASGIKKIVGEAITKPILRTAYGTGFQTANEFNIHELPKAVIDGAKRPEAINIRR